MQSPIPPVVPMTSPSPRALRVASLIEDIYLALVRDLAAGNIDGGVVMIARTRSNTEFSHSGAIVPGPRTTVRKLTECSLTSLARLFAVLSACHGLLLVGKKVSQRQLYYALINDFPDQNVLNESVLDASATLAVPRYCLNIGAATRGVVAGALTVSVPGARADVDCRFVGPLSRLLLMQNGWPIPGDIEVVSTLCMVSTARYIVVIEKFGIFQRLCEDRFFNLLPSILVCGKGYPSIATRALAMRLEQQFRLPVVGLADFNPHGLAILRTYRQGSIRSSIEGSPYVCNVRWLGLRASQIQRIDGAHAIGACGESLSSRDLALLASLRETVIRCGLGAGYMDELAEMEQVGKHELQWLFDANRRASACLCAAHSHNIFPCLVSPFAAGERASREQLKRFASEYSVVNNQGRTNTVWIFRWQPELVLNRMC